MSNLSDSIPQILTAHVQYIRPYILPDLLREQNHIKKPFKVLSTIESYAEYYTKFEKRKKLITEGSLKNIERNIGRPCFIPRIGNLLPIPKGHSFNSFWKGFRYKAKGSSKYFFLMPLTFSLRNIANQYRLDGRVYAYVFPFGILCINQELSYTGTSFSFKRLIERNRYKRRRFMEFSNFVAGYINEHIFDPHTDVKTLETHMMIFLDDATTSLVIGDFQHEKAIAGLIDSDIGFRGLARDYVSSLLTCRLPSRRRGEVLIFHPRTTFLQPSRIEKRSMKKSTHKCMRHNYADFLNFTFAINRYIREYKKIKNQIPKSRIDEVKGVIKAGFPKENGSYSTEYFKNIFPTLASRIHLNETLREFLEDE